MMRFIVSLILILVFPAISSAGPALSVIEAGTTNGIQPQVVPQIVDPKTGADVSAGPEMLNGGDRIPNNGASGGNGEPVAYGEDPALQEQVQGQQQNQIQNLLSTMMSGLTTGGSAPPPANTNWDTYSYPKDYKYGYGGQSAGDIGNGLCTAKNSDKAQVKNGYCAILADIITRPDTCAGRALDNIMFYAGGNGSGINELDDFCPTYGKLTSVAQKKLVFQQILATLIVQESGWNARAQEKPWTRADGAQMGGKGLFQIGVSDRSKGGDCAGLNASNILTAEANIKCGACIALSGIAEDRTMGHGTGDSGARGMAQYFGPMRDKQRAKRNSMASAVAQYCRALTGDGGNPESFTPVTGSPENITSPDTAN
jgi:hypothetical protein